MNALETIRQLSKEFLMSFQDVFSLLLYMRYVMDTMDFDYPNPNPKTKTDFIHWVDLRIKRINTGSSRVTDLLKQIHQSIDVFTLYQLINIVIQSSKNLHIFQDGPSQDVLIACQKMLQPIDGGVKNTVSNIPLHITSALESVMQKTRGKLDPHSINAHNRVSILREGLSSFTEEEMTQFTRGIDQHLGSFNSYRPEIRGEAYNQFEKSLSGLETSFNYIKSLRETK